MTPRFIAVLLSLGVIMAFGLAVAAARMDSGPLGIFAILLGFSSGARLLNLIDNYMGRD